jgi:4-hydroxybenzoyl-CoA reductase subunit beta
MSEMLPLPPFSLLQPDSIEACTSLLAQHPEAKIVAGGTDLLPSMKYGIFKPPTLISTQSIPALKAIEPYEGGIALGAGLSHWDLQQNAEVQDRYPSLAQACSQVATPTLQAMGTLGGNLMLDTRCIWYNQSQFWRGALGGCLKCEGDICHVAPKGTGCYAAHSADTVPVLMLLGAVVEFASEKGLRQIPVAELFPEDALKGPKALPGELLTRVLLPAPQGDVAYRKLRTRGAIDYPLLLTAVRVDRDASGAPTGGRIVLSAIGPCPLEVKGASEAIAAGDVESAAELAYAQAMPLSTHTTPSTWRKKMVRVEVRRALSGLMG